MHYLLYKRHHYHPKAVGIWAARARPDGSPRAAAPGRSRSSTAEGRQIEAPSVVSRQGRVYVFASRLSYDSCAYKTVVFVGGALRRPLRPLGTLRLRRPDGRRFCGPGGAEVRDVEGTFRMVFHAFDKNPKTTPRAPRFVWGGPLRWTDDGSSLCRAGPVAGPVRAQGEGELQHERGVLEPVAVQLAQLAHRGSARSAGARRAPRRRRRGGRGAAARSAASR